MERNIVIASIVMNKISIFVSAFIVSLYYSIVRMSKVVSCRLLPNLRKYDIMLVLSLPNPDNREEVPVWN